MRKYFGETKLGIVSSILYIAGCVIAAIGTIGNSMDNKALVKEEAVHAASNITE